jgi:hypothetical protein
MDEWAAMERACWEKYAEVKAQVLGEPVDRELVESRVSSFMEYTLHKDQRWRNR